MLEVEVHMRGFLKNWSAGPINEALLLEEEDDDAWCRHLLQAAERCVQVPILGLQRVRYDESFEMREISLFGYYPPGVNEAIQLLSSVEPHMFRALFGPGGAVANAAHIFKLLGHRNIQGIPREFGVRDAYAVRAFPEQGHTVVLSWGSGEGRLEHSARDMALLRGLAVRMEAALRLRLSRDVEGALDPNGNLLDPGGPATRDDVWSALKTGRVTMVPRGRERARHYVLVQNAAASRLTRALSSVEAFVWEQLVSGAQAKTVSTEAGTSPSGLSRLLASSAGKLGLESTFEALRLLGGLLGPSQSTDLSTLSQAELEVLHLVRTGHSNAEIAGLRRTSVRTVANQVASLLRKTGRPGRRALVSLRHRATNDHGQLRSASGE
jgi:DNA-binding CsgD family transcriptional regulator